MADRLAEDITVWKRERIEGAFTTNDLVDRLIARVDTLTAEVNSLRTDITILRQNATVQRVEELERLKEIDFQRFEGKTLQNDGKILELEARLKDHKATANAALDRAAEVVEGCGDTTETGVIPQDACNFIAAAIRKMKDQP